MPGSTTLREQGLDKQTEGQIHALFPPYKCLTKLHLDVPGLDASDDDLCVALRPTTMSAYTYRLRARRGISRQRLLDDSLHLEQLHT